jgi:dimethylhistidine N-methyltransferase
MSDYRFFDRLRADAVGERRAIVAGLLAYAPAIAPKHFYDPVGCALFGAICELPEYYPTRTERAIFVDYREEITEAIGRGRQFVDLGAGDCFKAQGWLPFLAPRRYIAVDIAGDALARALARMAPEFPELEVTGIVADFTRGLDLREDLGDAPAMFFYPGSSIGNFQPDDARRFLSDIHLHCIASQRSGLLIGVDTKKESRRLAAAYDDSLGVTAAFNRNVLRHVNQIVGADFDPAAFTHVAFYNEQHGRIEMHLAARKPQVVRIDGSSRTFATGDLIHTEYSYKYTPAEFTTLLHDAGFADVRCWQDAARDFAVYWAT